MIGGANDPSMREQLVDGNVKILNNEFTNLMSLVFFALPVKINAGRRYGFKEVSFYSESKKVF